MPEDYQTLAVSVALQAQMIALHATLLAEHAHELKTIREWQISMVAERSMLRWVIPILASVGSAVLTALILRRIVP